MSLVVGDQLVSRLCRLPCGKPPAFRQGRDWVGGYAARGEASPYFGNERKTGGFPHGRRQSRKTSNLHLATGNRRCLHRFIPRMICVWSLRIRVTVAGSGSSDQTS